MQLMQQQAQPQREKLVASLKDQIKKLQKDRDKIKTWCEPFSPPKALTSCKIEYTGCPHGITRVWHHTLRHQRQKAV
jgi:hypothetical protein